MQAQLYESSPSLKPCQSYLKHSHMSHVTLMFTILSVYLHTWGIQEVYLNLKNVYKAQFGFPQAHIHVLELKTSTSINYVPM